MEVDQNEGSSGGRKKGTKFTNRKDEGNMECDLSAYALFHEGSTGAPCLSFDIVRDSLGDDRGYDSPVTCCFVCGSQAVKRRFNSISLVKMSNLRNVDSADNDSEDEESSDEEEVRKPCITSVSTPHDGCVNRIRTQLSGVTTLAASWSEQGRVHIWDLDKMIEAVNDGQSMRHYQNSDKDQPIFTFRGHQTEGFALAWSPTMPGCLASGDCFSKIYVWTPQEGGGWLVDDRPFTGHRDSVEDIQWSPNEKNVFASCSVDKSIRVWDTRVESKKACMLNCEEAHDSDVNVIHWNCKEPFIASGGDDSKILIWDLRKFETKSPVAHLQFHSGPVCTVEWHPSDSSVFASGGEDDQILQWDLAVEKDSKEKEETSTENIPQQLLFVHKGQKEVKELHWHPQIPGLIISTAHSGFNIFKTISC